MCAVLENTGCLLEMVLLSGMLACLVRGQKSHCEGLQINLLPGIAVSRGSICMFSQREIFDYIISQCTMTSSFLGV